MSNFTKRNDKFYKEDGEITLVVIDGFCDEVETQLNEDDLIKMLNLLRGNEEITCE